MTSRAPVARMRKPRKPRIRRRKPRMRRSIRKPRISPWLRRTTRKPRMRRSRKMGVSRRYICIVATAKKILQFGVESFQAVVHNNGIFVSLECVHTLSLGLYKALALSLAKSA